MLRPEAQPEHGSDLKQAFLRHLPERVGAIEENWFSLTSEGWSPTKLARLFQRIQDLAGSAGKFGLIQVSESVFSLEQYFHAFLSNREQPSARQVEEVNGLIHHLKAVVEDVKRPLAETLLRTEEKRPRVFYLRQSDALAPGLVGALETLQCVVLRFTREDDLLAEAAQEPAAAIVVDGQLLSTLVPIMERLGHDKGGAAGGARPALIVLSSSSSLDIRLAAMRAGAEAFFVAPVDAPAVAARIHQLSAPASQRPCRVMIVDDDPSQADFAAAILRKADMETCAVTEPLQALDTLDAFRPDLILMDLYMPGADGMELTSVIREQNEFVGIPIIFVSGEQDTDKQLDALSVGGDDFIAKPIRPRHLITTIKNRVQRARALQDRSTGQSHRDPVTGLFNRRHFFERLDNAVAGGAPQPAARGVLMLEIDRREALQGAIGIGQTDALLAELGALIAAQSEPQDVCARLSEGGFVVLAKRPLERNLVQLGDALLQAVAQRRLPVEGLPFQPSLSAGLCLFDSAPDDASGLVSRAAKACARAQQQGGNRLEVYSPLGAPPQPQDTLSLMRQALRENSFRVLFQPFVDLRDERRESYEMLLRLRTAEGDQLAAGEFLPVAKQAGLSREIDRWLTGRALDVLDERRQAGSDVQLLIHQTVEILVDPEGVTWLQDELRRRLLVGTGLLLELNLVDVVSDIKGARTMINELRGMDIEICLARFGHNDASYKILHYLGAGYVKVVEKLLGADAALIGALVQRVHELGARVIVPRVDDPRMIGQQWLTGADFVQGNAIQRPQELPAYDFSMPLRH
jgi:diguanylate cyclase (GGDEF)-like protein